MAQYKIEAGELCQKITIYARETAKDEAGFDLPPSETPLLSCWAKFARVSGTEALKAGADYSTVRVRFIIRATPKLIGWESRDLWINYRSQDYEVQYVNEYGDRHEWTELVCELRERSTAEEDDDDGESDDS